MRFERLSLLKYGHFDGCDLTFSPGPMDFHLIMGANEAGKSTTLAAVSDLLFGFPKTSPYSFRFAGPLLRLGAALRHDGRDLVIRRRKGYKDTLLDDAEQPLADATLLPLLQGVSRDAFRIAHSLDHRRLEEGGRAILEAKDDVGQALFAAGSGLIGVQALLRDLEIDADAIWARTRSTRRSYTQVETELASAQARLKSAQVRPKEWVSARDEFAQLSHRQSELRDERVARQSDLRKVQRVRRIAAAVQSRAALLETVAGLAPSPFDVEHERTHDQALDAISGSQLVKGAAATAAAELCEKLSDVPVDEELLAQQQEISQLVSEAGAAKERADHLPVRQAELRTLEATVTRVARELGFGEPEAVTLQDALPSRIALADLQGLAVRRARLDTALETLKDQLALDEEAAERSKSALLASPEVAEDEAAQVALREGQRAVAVDARLKERRRAVERLGGALTTALGQLQPWAGEIAALAALKAPGEPEIVAAEARLKETSVGIDTETRDLRDFSQSRERLEAELRRFSEDRTVVSTDQVLTSRARRDALWRPVRDHLTSGSPLNDPAAAAEALEGAVGATDRVLDARFETAEASARLADLDDRIAVVALDIEQAKVRLAHVMEIQTSRNLDWDSGLAAAGVPIVTPGALRQWLADRADALGIAGELQDAVKALADDEQLVSAALAGLRGALDEASLAAVEATAPFGRVLDAVQRGLEAVSLKAAQRSTLATQASSAEDAVASGRRRMALWEAEITKWEHEWEKATALAKLPEVAWNTMGARAPLFEQLRGAIDATLEMRRRVTGIIDDQKRFEHRSNELARLCRFNQPGTPQELTRALRMKLQKAVGDHREAETLQSSLERKLAEEREAEHLIAAAVAKLEPLMLMSGCQDGAALTRAIEDSRALRQGRVDVLALEQSLLKEGDGHPLETLLEEVRSLDPNVFQSEADRLEGVIADLDADVAAVAQSVGVAKQIFQGLDHGDDAAVAAADAEQARAAMADEAEAYLIQRAQAVMLKWGLEKYRERRQNPLLARAGEIFATLTLGRYTDLQIDLDGDQLRLFGICRDGASTVPVAGMSDGTADQLYLALRLSALEQSLEAGIILPFLADDLFINFDDQRAHAGFKILGELARKTQVLFFSHHNHLREIAEDALHPDVVSICEFA